MIRDGDATFRVNLTQFTGRAFVSITVEDMSPADDWSPDGPGMLQPLFGRDSSEDTTFGGAIVLVDYGTPPCQHGALY